MRSIRLVVCMAMAFSVAMFCGAEKIKLAIFLLEPFEMAGADNKPTGVTVDYWQQYIAPKMGVDLEVVGPFPINRATKMLQDGEVDVVTQLTKTSERQAYALYPETNLTEITTCLLVNPDSTIKSVTKPEDLFGKRIGYFEGGVLPAFFQNDKIIVERLTAQDYRMANLNKLFGKRIDAVLDINYASMLYYLKQNNLKDKVKVLKLPGDPLNVYSIFQKSDKGRRLMQSYEKAQSELKKTDAFDKLSKKYLE